MNSQTILLVDDDSDLLQVVGQRCRSIGLNVQHARNLLTAMAVIDRFVPDLICVDVEMPTGNGLRFCETLAADPRTADLPVIVLTGRKDDETMQKCGQMGAHYLFKSADIWASLEPLVRRLMSTVPPERTRATTGIRPRNLPAHSIPPWPGEADVGKNNRADTGKCNGATAGDSSELRSDDELDAPPVRPDAKARQVVVADDDNDLVQMLSERFSSLGCSVIGVNTSLDGINAIHRVHPDMVVLDVNMPSGSGLTVCEMMASDEKLRLVPVIVLTGCADEKTIRRCHDMLVFYVQKGTNVWSRIDPLVRELLHLEVAPLPPVPKVSDKTIETNSPMPTLPIGAVETESLLDAVFEMLGAESSVMHGDGQVPAAGAREVVHMPWILCIDDDFDFYDALKMRFDEYGVAVARAANGLAGFRMAFTTPANAILLDYQMPNGKGDYILDRLKSNPVTRDIPVYMITGVKDKMLERRVIGLGAAGYLLKPVKFEQLRERLSEHIDALKSPARRLLVSPLSAAAT